jgi:uncharacterized tellurite resistance protein B-like protein
MVVSRDFYEALGCLTYAIALSDNEIEADELKSFGRIMLDSFGERDMQSKGMRAYARFEMLADSNTSSEEAYNKALSLFKTTRDELAMYRDTLIDVLHKMAISDNDSEHQEAKLINRFTEDIERILN